ncbi:MAG: ABC transporter substrate-binding protein, partial [Anaerolineales bacterium]|nr:ABC transporter substrate-binding protein [Anaerolineales bacterium]
MDSPAAHILFDIAGARAFHEGQVDEIGVRAIDDFTLEVELEDPASYFLPLLANPVFLPVPQHLVERFGEAWTAADRIQSNGPYLLKSFEAGQKLVLGRNPGYTGSFPGSIDRYELIELPDREQAIEMYRRGEVDVLYLWPFSGEREEQLLKEFPQDHVAFPKETDFFLYFEISEPPFNDARIRQAFAHAVDIKTLVDNYAGRHSDPALGGLIPPAIPGHSPDIGLVYDPERARQLLTESGYSEGRGFPGIKLVTFNALADDAHRIAGYWAENLGVHVDVDVLEFSLYIEKARRGGYALILGGYTPDFLDPEDFFRMQAEWVGFSTPEFEALLKEARRETDQSRRVDLYRQADRILIEAAVVRPWTYYGADVLAKPWARGLNQGYKGLKYLGGGPRSVQVEARLKNGEALPKPEPALLEASQHIVRDYIFGLSEPALDPGLVNDSFSSALVQEIFRGLVELRPPDLEVLPDAARSWDILDHGRRYLFHLHDDMRWSDGLAVTAHDFVFAWKRILDPALGSEVAHLLMDLRGARAFYAGRSQELGVRALHDYTLEVELEQPAGYFLPMLSHNAFLPVPRHVVERHGAAWTKPGNMISNGPFLLRELIPDRIVLLVRNPDYTGDIPGNVERFETLLLRRPEDAIPLYREGAIDAIYLFPFPPDVEGRLMEEFKGDYSRASGSWLSYLRFDHSSPPFDDPTVRRAFVQAADVQAVIRRTSGRHSAPALGGIIPPGIPGHSPRLALPNDPALARDLLAEAGHPDGRDIPRLSLLTHHPFGEIARMLADSWAEVLHVRVDLELLDFDEFMIERDNDRHGLYIGGYGLDFLDPEDLFRTLPRLAGFTSPEYEAALERARRETDQARRIEYYQQADRILIESAAILPLSYRRSDTVSRPWARRMAHDYKGLKYLNVPVSRGPGSGEKVEQVVRSYTHDLGIQSLDPGLAYDSTSYSLIVELFRGLVELRVPDLDVLPDGARSWDIQEEGRRYVFYLHDDMVWSDGRQVTAHDYVFAWQRALDPALDSKAAHLLFDIAGARGFHEGRGRSLGVQAVDDLTLKVDLEKPASYFLQLLAHEVFRPVPRHIVEEYRQGWTDPDRIITNGPYRLQVLEPGERIVLARNPRYTGAFPGNIGRYELRLGVDPGEAIDLYRTGSLDVLSLYPYSPEVYNRLVEEFSDDFYSADTYSSPNLQFDLSRPPLNDTRLRRAFVHASDVGTIVRESFGRYYVPASGGLIPPGIPGHSPDIGLPYDPERARRLLAESGYAGGQGLSGLKMISYSEEGFGKIARVLARSWFEILGVDVQVDVVDLIEFTQPARTAGYHFVLTGYAIDFPDPEDLFRMQAEQNGYATSEFNETLEKARRETDQARRIEHYRDADRMLIENAAVLPVLYSGNAILTKPWLRGFTGGLESLKFLTAGPRPEALPAESPEPSGKEGAVVRDYQVGRLAPTLDPTQALDYPSYIINRELFQGLVEMTNPDMIVLPDGARSWEIQEGGKKYIFYLRDDARWSDGTPVTAHDYVFAWRRALDPEKDSPAAHLLFDIAGARDFHAGQSQELGARAIDRLTLAVELEGPASYFLQLVTNRAFAPVPKHVVERYGESWTDAGHIVTNGPFLLDSGDPGHRIALVRNPHYAGSFPGNVGRYELQSVDSPNAALELYRRGKVDVLYLAQVPLEEENRLRRTFKDDLTPVIKSSMVFAHFDHKNHPFSDERVRRAFAFAVDVGALAGETAGRHSDPALGGVVLPWIPGHSPDIGLPFDPELARRLLAEAGYPEGLGFPSQKLLTHSELAPQAEKMAESWSALLGVQIEIEVLDLQDFREADKGAGYGLILTGQIPDFPDPESVFRELRETVGFEPPKLAEALAAARRETDQARRLDFYREADRLLVESAAVIPVSYVGSDRLTKPWARGLNHPWQGLKFLTVGERPRQSLTSVAAPERVAGETIRLDWSEPATLDPLKGEDIYAIDIIRHLFSGLVKIGPENEIIPDVARSWEISNNGRRYVFHLRDDVMWSDGRPVIADDFEYAWKQTLSPKRNKLSAATLYDLRGARDFNQGLGRADQVGVSARDDRTLVVDLDEPTPYFLLLMGKSFTLPVPRHVAEIDPGHWADPGRIVTNGPFRLGDYSMGKSMVFQRNPDFHDRFGGNLERVELYFRGAGLDSRVAFEAADLDVVDITYLEPETIMDLRGGHSSLYRSMPFLFTQSLMVNGWEPFDDLRVRQALALAIDQEQLAEALVGKTQLPALGGFIPPGMPGHSPGIGLPHDPTRAQKLLAEAGYPGGRDFPEVSLIAPYFGFDYFERMMAHLTRTWQETLGIRVNWDASIEFGEYIERVKEDPPHLMAGGQIADYPDPENFLSTGIQLYKVRWSHPEYDRLLQQSRAMTDQGQRLDLLRQAERILMDEAAVIPLLYARQHFLVHPWVKVFPVSAMGERYWDDIVVERPQSVQAPSPDPSPGQEPRRSPDRPPGPAPIAGETIRLDAALSAEFDPLKALEVFSAYVQHRIFSGLVKVRPGLEITPDVAQSWEVSKDGLQYTFHLREDVFWSDGRPVTAADFAYGWRRRLTSGTDYSAASMLYDIRGARAFHLEGGAWDQVGVQAVDGRTLVIELEAPASYFLLLMGHTAALPVPRHMVEDMGDRWTEPGRIVTNGPFLVDPDSEEGLMVFRKNPKYHDSFAGNVGRVELELRGESFDHLAEFGTGRFDALDITYLEAQPVLDLQQRYPDQYTSHPHLFVTNYWIYPRPPFDDPRVRQAFVMAIDNEFLAAQIMKNTQPPASGGFIPPGMPGHSPDIGLGFNPARARELLVEAGYPAGEGFPQVNIIAPFLGYDYQKPIVRYLAKSWEETLGVTVNLEEGMSFEQLFARSAEEDVHIIHAGWIADYPDPDNFLRTGADNWGRLKDWSHPEFFRLIEEARQMKDQRERMERYRLADRILMEEALVVPLLYSQQRFLRRPLIKQMPVSPTGEIYWEDIVVERPEPEERTAPAPSPAPGSPADPFPGETIRLEWGEPNSLDPMLAEFSFSFGAVQQLFSGLIEVGPDLSILPDVAQRWELSSDGLRYVFHLREDVFWSDGTPVTAGDFEYAWKRVMAPGSKNSQVELLFPIRGAREFSQGAGAADQVGVRAEDDYTLVVDLEAPVSYFLLLMDQGVARPVPRHRVEQDEDGWAAADRIVTNGPFLLRSHTKGESMEFVRNPRYHRPTEGNV